MGSGERSKTNRAVQKEIDEILKTLSDDEETTSESICSMINKNRRRSFCPTRIGALLRQRDDLQNHCGKWKKVKCNA